MSKLAKEIMTPSPQCCSAETLLNEVANLMVEADCGEIPVTDSSNRLVGVITDRDIVCRVVADGKNPSAYPAEHCMTTRVITVPQDAPIGEVLAAMEKHQVRRVPVVDERGGCVGMISQADIAWASREKEVAELVREVSRDTGNISR